jgi:hypothetical protein
MTNQYYWKEKHEFKRSHLFHQAGGTIMSVLGKNSGSRQRQVFLLRLPQPLKEQLKQQAKANQRSLNSEIIALLEGNGEGCSGN